MLWSCKLGKKPGQKLISWVTKPNPTVTIVVKKDSHLFPLNAVNEKLFWSLIFLRVRILLLMFLAIFILLCVLAFSFSSKPAALPEVVLCFYLLGGALFWFCFCFCLVFLNLLERNCTDGDRDQRLQCWYQSHDKFLYADLGFFNL